VVSFTATRHIASEVVAFKDGVGNMSVPPFESDVASCADMPVWNLPRAIIDLTVIVLGSKLCWHISKRARYGLKIRQNPKSLLGSFFLSSGLTRDQILTTEITKPCSSNYNYQIALRISMGCAGEDALTPLYVLKILNPVEFDKICLLC
jgi:hypothetical protein